jgi:hypothetical protein
MILLRYDSLATDKLKVLSSEMDPAEIIGSFDWSSLKGEARKVSRKIPHPLRALSNIRAPPCFIIDNRATNLDGGSQNLLRTFFYHLFSHSFIALVDFYHIFCSFYLEETLIKGIHVKYFLTIFAIAY